MANPEVPFVVFPITWLLAPATKPLHLHATNTQKPPLPDVWFNQLLEAEGEKSWNELFAPPKSNPANPEAERLMLG